MSRVQILCFFVSFLPQKEQSCSKSQVELTAGYSNKYTLAKKFRERYSVKLRRHRITLPMSECIHPLPYRYRPAHRHILQSGPVPYSNFA
jgi:hypothetical protein